MARVNVDTKALIDPRFAHLGELIGGSRYEALGLCVHVWAICYEMETPYLSKQQINSTCGPEFHLKMLRSRLARGLRGGSERMYICGTKGRIEWVKTCRQRASEGGKARATRAARTSSGHFALKAQPTEIIGNQHQLGSSLSSSAPAPAPAPVIEYNPPTPQKIKKTLLKTQIVESPPDLGKIWNENCGDLPKTLGLGSKRIQSWKSRWKEKPDLDYWTLCIKKLSQSKFCTGHNDRSWIATIDFLLRPDTHLKVYENLYDERKNENHESKKTYLPLRSARKNVEGSA